MFKIFFSENKKYNNNNNNNNNYVLWEIQRTTDFCTNRVVEI